MRGRLLTGRYAFRNPRADRVLSGVSPLSIGLDETTVASMLHDAGYHTGLVGKWHLGLGERQGSVDYNGEIKPGPLEVGFDYAYYIPATGDRVPCVYVDGRRVDGLDPADPITVNYRLKVGDDPTGRERPDLLKMKADLYHSGTIINGVSRIGHMDGGDSARWVDEDLADHLTSKAVAFIEADRDRPFFLYYAPHDIHEPMVPHARFKGTSDCGSRGDVIHQLDWSMGELLAALDRKGLADDTIVIFSSDNGGGIKDTYDDGTNVLHPRQPPNGSLRGEKGTVYEGGHRVPFVARWPGRIKAGSTADELLCQMDLLPTLAAMAGATLPPGAGPDAVDLSAAILGEDRGSPPRDQLLSQGWTSAQMAVRKGPWKLIPMGSASAVDELYNLDDDPAETTNLAFKRPDKVGELKWLLLRTRMKS